MRRAGPAALVGLFAWRRVRGVPKGGGAERVTGKHARRRVRPHGAGVSAGVLACVQARAVAGVRRAFLLIPAGGHGGVCLCVRVRARVWGAFFLCLLDYLIYNSLIYKYNLVVMEVVRVVRSG